MSDNFEDQTNLCLNHSMCWNYSVYAIETVDIKQVPVTLHLCQTCYMAWHRIKDEIYRPKGADDGSPDS